MAASFPYEGNGTLLVVDLKKEELISAIFGKKGSLMGVDLLSFEIQGEGSPTPFKDS